jgi:hypothetical protein
MASTRRSADAAASVMITCPVTGKEVSTGFSSVSTVAFQRIQLERLLFRCSACGEDHVWSKEDAYLR